MTLNILSIDEGEEYYEPPVPVYWVNTQFEQWADDAFSWGMKDILANISMQNAVYSGHRFVGDTLRIEVPLWLS